MSRKPLVAANWKMHGDLEKSGDLAQGIASAVDVADTIDACICPVGVHLHVVRQALRGEAIRLGAQNVCDRTGEGAFTGEVSAEMLADAGCRYVIVGHSERRRLYGESNGLIARKFAAAKTAGLVPILCVGESEEQRDQGRTEAVLGRQIEAITELSGAQAFADSVVAYEPVWAIGTGKSATPEMAQEVHAFLRAKIGEQDGILAADLRLLYGGSVKPENAQALFSQADIDGGLIGGASLDSAKFAALCRAAAENRG